ncbi:MAG: isoaspartyl peptidase/L-asparaginase, partial [Acidobacteriaceae bacterium]
MSFKIAPVLAVHGGAWDIPDDLVEPHRQGVSNALAAGYALLEKGASALDAVESAVAIMEDDEAFDAGRGSFLTSEGHVQLDALLMDGATLRAGGVACVERLRNPIHAARLVLDLSPHVYFVGAGAEAFAAEHGMPLIDNSELVIDRERHHLADAQQKLRNASATGSSAAAAAAAHLSAMHAGTSHDTVGAVALDGRG